MSKITEIEKAITQLGPGEFQKFCDSFLSRLEKYGTILSLGMKSGTSKTTIGNPDTYFRKENGKYVLVVYTTQQNNIYSKIKEDIDKSLDSSKTGIDIKDIEEIICCHTSSNLTAGEDNKLHEYCANQGIQLTIFGVDEIAQYIFKKDPILAKDFLGISVDTNQIMSAKDFVDLYDSKEMVAPLNTVFQHREKELQQLKDKIKDNSVVIVYGHAGIGKTRIVLEATRQFAQENDYKLLCIRNNYLGLYEDLFSYTRDIDRYLFFVDDANKITGLQHILEYISKKNQGYEIKIILTVRDYVKEQVFGIVQQFTKPISFELKSFKDDEIKSFLDVNMEIRNDDYVSQIIRIAEGNPRIAYMAGKLAKDTHSLKAIHDVTELYEQYYDSIIKSYFENDLKLCYTMGILAVIKAVILDNLDNLEEFLNSMEISKIEFSKNVHRLFTMKFVEHYENSTAVISDQCFANYMLYYVFFEKKLLHFSTVLEFGFKHFRKELIHSINTLLNLFSKDSLHEYIKLEIKTIWNKFCNNNDPCYLEFVKEFHVFQPEEAFIIAEEKINKIQQQPFINHNIEFKNTTVNSPDFCLELLTGYNNSEYMETVVDLLMSFVEKSENNAISGYSWFIGNYYINYKSSRYDYYTENIIIKALSKYLNSNELSQRFILKYISYVLSFEFRPTEIGRGDTFTSYHVPISISDGVKKYRKVCWDILNYFQKFKYLNYELYNLLFKYATSIYRTGKPDVIKYDYIFINKIISTIHCSNLKMALLIREFQYAYKPYSLFCPDTNKVLDSEEWNLYQLLEKKYYYYGLQSKVYNVTRKDKLIKYAQNLLVSNIPEFFKRTNNILEEITDLHYIDKRSILNGIQDIVNNISVNKETVETLLISMIKFGSNIEIYPSFILKKLFEVEDVNDIWELIENKQYYFKNNWEFAYFQEIPDNKVTEEIYQRLLSFFHDDSDKNIKSSPYRNLHMLDKFHKYDTNIYVTVSKIILEKRRYNAVIVNLYFEFLFFDTDYTPLELINLFRSDLDVLKSIYFFMLEYGCFNDYDGVFLSEFLKLDDSWGDTFANSLIKMIKAGKDHDFELCSVLWLSDNYIKYFDKIFIKISDEKDYYLASQLENIFINVSNKQTNIIKQRQKNWLLHIIRQYSHDERIKTIFIALSENTSDIKKTAIIEFLKNNNNFEMFEKLQLDPYHWGGFVEEIIPDLHKKINYLESFLPFLSGSQYIRHKKRIKDKIDEWKTIIKHEELENIHRDLFK